MAPFGLLLRSATDPYESSMKASSRSNFMKRIYTPTPYTSSCLILKFWRWEHAVLWGFLRWALARKVEQSPTLRVREQSRRNNFNNMNYTVFHKNIIFAIVWLSMTMTECMFSFNLQCLNNFRKSLEMDLTWSNNIIPSMQSMLNCYEKDLKRALSVNPAPNELYPCDSLVVKF